MNSRQEQLLQEADSCVKCGLCLAVCPSYQVLANEADSPRGRISLLQGLWTGALVPDETLEGHLRGCLQCLRCQAACPAGLDYRQLIEAGLAELPKPHAWLLWLLTEAPTRPWLLSVFRFWRKTAWFHSSLKLIPRSWRRLLGLLPPPSPVPLAAAAQPQGPTLFLGCVSALVDNQAQLAFVRLCAAFGLNIQLAEGQGCCGALHAHCGWPDHAHTLAERNAKAFAQSSHIISLGSGCGAHLHRLYGDRVVDAVSWLLGQPWPESIQFRPLRQRLALHIPCSQRLDAQQAVFELVQRIPQAQVFKLASGYGCCGGSGMALVEQPQLGQQLMRPLVDELRVSGADVVMTTNSGCALQFRQALAEAGLGIEVVHPLELLARCLA